MSALAWDKLHSDVRHRLDYPSEHVIRFLRSLVHFDGFRMALDIGCGTGRHLKLLQDFGYEAYGVDASREAVTRSQFYEHGMPRVSQGPMTDLPINNPGCFSVVLSYGVFYYGTRANHKKAISEMRQQLRSDGGQGFVCIRSDRDWRFDADLAGEPEQGMTLDFAAENELEELYGGFTEWSYESAEWTTNGRSRLNSDWLITVTR